jgi:hypothetical protein
MEKKPESLISLRSYVIESLKRYWPENMAAVSQLPIPVQTIPQHVQTPPVVRYVKLPGWAAEFGINNKIPVPEWAVLSAVDPIWQQTDWLMTIHWYMNGLAEQQYEKEYGTIHSYSIRLKGWNSDLWERAWVNRIALFLRKWAAIEKNCDETQLLGPLPDTEILLTHDVDAVSKTLPIRFKQTAFHFYNAAKLIYKWNFSSGLKKAGKGLRFLFSSDDYWCFETIMEMEKQADKRSCFNFSGGSWKHNRSLKEKLFDPSYDVRSPRLKETIQKLQSEGWTIGLHPSFLAWEDSNLIKAEKRQLEKATKSKVSTCRQHWLRFSWQKTWQAQQDAGVRLDTTLGFNDRPGFRNGAALRFHPQVESSCSPMAMEVIPMVLMDSHFYDYQDMSPDERKQKIDHWLNEIKFVRGQVSIIWHQRVMSSDYGWGEGYRYVLQKVT